MSTSLCKKCNKEIDDQDILDAGMEEICHQCWEERLKTNSEKE